MAAERRVALCVARFYTELAERLEEGARAGLDDAGVTRIESFSVPGAFELPLVAKYAAESGRYDAVVCLGAVIRGETDHYDYVCRSAAEGITQVGLETGVPCGFGVHAIDVVKQRRSKHSCHINGAPKREDHEQRIERRILWMEAAGKRVRAGNGFLQHRRRVHGAVPKPPLYENCRTGQDLTRG